MNESDRSTDDLSMPQLSFREALRLKLRKALEEVLDEELAAVLDAGRHERSDQRRGYRNGSLERTVVTEQGPETLEIPRGRLFRADRGSAEWHSQMLPRYPRRSARVDQALLGAYLAGANTRRIRKALTPLLGERYLSRSAISRIVQRLKDLFESWRGRDLSQETIPYLFFDGFYVPVQAVLGVRADGEKELVSLQIAASESTASWTAAVADLKQRRLPAPLLTVLDGNAGLVRAVKEAWPSSAVQRCTKHKLENLLAKAPRHAHGELKRDYAAIVRPVSAEAARRAYDAFLHKWRKLRPEVARCLEEAGEDLLTFTRFPGSQWKSLRTTNQLERLNGEFRRRTKTQGSFRSETSALVLLFGLVALGVVRLRKIDGWKKMTEVHKNLQQAA